MATPSKTKHSPQVTCDVTAEIIEMAIPRDSGHCMAADAVAAAFPDARYISVDVQTIRFSDLKAGQRYIYLTPRSVQKALLDFDDGVVVEPFTFRLYGAHVLPTRRGSSRASTPTKVVPSRSGSTAVREGGSTPPMGPLAGEAQPPHGRRPANAAQMQPGRRREFGLRAFRR